MPDTTSHTERRVSSDAETIRKWARSHDVDPVSRPDGDGPPVDLVVASEVAEYEPVEWTEFQSALDESDAAVVYRGPDADDPFTVTDRETAIDRADVEDDSAEAALLEGETVTTEVTETTVVERTVVEEAELESEVTDREVVEERIVGGRLLSREFDCDVEDPDAATVDRDFDAAQFEVGHQWDESLPVTVTADEEWRLTKEVLERVTVETEVVEAAVSESDSVEHDSVEHEVDIEGVQADVLDSGVVAADTSTTDLVERGSLESERSGDTVHTRLVERRTYDEDVALRKQYSGDLDGETTDVTMREEDLVESAVVDGDEVAFEMETRVDTAADVETDVAAEADPEADLDDASVERDTDGDRDATIARDTERDGDVDGDRGDDADRSTDAGRDADTIEDRGTPEPSDEGKPVVDADEETVGVVTRVEGDTLYVDPDPSVVDHLKSILDWDLDGDADDQPVPADRVGRVTHRRVELVDQAPHE